MGIKGTIRRVLPPGLLKTIRFIQSVVMYRLYRPSHGRLWGRDLHSQIEWRPVSLPHRETYRRALIDWLKVAQNVASGGGVAAYYGFQEGWAAAYPETTGYIICTFLDAARRYKEPDLAECARRMAEWECAVQMPQGAWQSGHVNAEPIPAVFNTGQIIQGLLSVHEYFGDSRYLAAAERGGWWLTSVQDKDGAWRRHTYNEFPNTYSTRVAWPLIVLALRTGEQRFEETATKYLDWVCSQQDEEGWFQNCTLEPSEPPLTHTLGYTIEGLLESGELLNNRKWVKSALKAADALLKRFEVHRILAGAYDKGWQGDFSFVCVTGCAQMSRNWSRLYQLTGDVRYLNGALKLNDIVAGLITLRTGNRGIRGGVKGSHPIWGHYMPGRFPSWAAKFALDAFFSEEDGLSLLTGNKPDRNRLLPKFKDLA